MSYAAVFPLVRTRAFDEAFDYEVPAELQGRLVRRRARGRARWAPQTVIGVVLELRAETRARRPGAARARPARRAGHPGGAAGAGRTRAPPTTSPRSPRRWRSSARRPGALKVVRQYELTAAGGGAADAGETGPCRARRASSCRRGSLRRAAERYRRKGWLRLAYRVHVVGGARRRRGACARGPETPARLGPRQRAALQLVEEAGALDDAACAPPAASACPGCDVCSTRARWPRSRRRSAPPEAPARAAGDAVRRRSSPRPPACGPAPTLGDVPDLLPEQRQALHDDPVRGASRRRGAGARRHRQRQDRGLPAGRPGGPRGRPLGAPPGARDRAHRPDRRPRESSASTGERRRGAALGTLGRRAPPGLRRAWRAARPASSSARAPPSSRRSGTSVSSSSTRSTTPPTSRRASPPTTPAPWRAGAAPETGAVVVLGSATPSARELRARAAARRPAPARRRLAAAARSRSSTCATITASSRRRWPTR